MNGTSTIGIEFLGCGAACDPEEPNTAFLLTSGRACLLFDCGFTVPHRLAGRLGDPDRLDAVWISHFHGDHCFGLPLLFLKLSELGRGRELVVAGPVGLAERLRTLLAMAYGSLAGDCGFAWRVVELAPGGTAAVAGARLTAAESVHHPPALAVRCDCGGRSLFYSGDGRPSAAAVAMARGVELAVLECFAARAEVPGHNNLAGVMEFAAGAEPRRCALVHVDGGARTELSRLLEKAPEGDRFFVPRAGETAGI